MKITIAHSPDSDDAFMFYGFASEAVSTNGFEIGQVLADIETLNRAAFDGTYEATAVSFHAYAHLFDRYALLPHGGSMGDRYGPIVVTRAEGPTSLDGVTVAIPGRLTTAYLALQLYHPGVAFEVVPFDEIQPRVLDGTVEAGLLIHEGQLTYGGRRAAEPRRSRRVVGEPQRRFARCRSAATSSVGIWGASRYARCRACCTPASRTPSTIARRRSPTRYRTAGGWIRSEPIDSSGCT